MSTPPRPVIVRRADLPRLTGLSARQCDRLAAQGKFPARRKLGNNSSGWLLAEIEAWAKRLEKA